MKTKVIHAESTLIQVCDQGGRSVAQIKVDKNDLNDVAIDLLRRGMSEAFASRLEDIIRFGSIDDLGEVKA